MMEREEWKGIPPKFTQASVAGEKKEDNQGERYDLSRVTKKKGRRNKLCDGGGRGWDEKNLARATLAEEVRKEKRITVSPQKNTLGGRK